MTVALYGNKEGRSCRAEGPTVLETIPIEKEYIDDPALPIGTEKELEPRLDGLRRRELPHHQPSGPTRPAGALRRALFDGEVQGRPRHDAGATARGAAAGTGRTPGHPADVDSVAPAADSPTLTSIWGAAGS